MTLFRITAVTLFFTWTTVVFAQKENKKKQEIQIFDISESMEYGYKKPKFFDMIKYVPKDITDFGKFIVKKKNLKWTGSALGATGLLVPFDQQLVNGAIDIGDGIGWDKGHSYSNIGPLRIIPNDLHSAVYYIGNGGTTMLLSGAFYAFGIFGKDYRALNTSSELIEVILSMGVITQTIKRITGRQSPDPAFKDGNPGGHWTLFPSFKDYQTNTINYDAMPSGHVATFMATLTVIATNYPEIKWIKPVGYSLMGIMAFEMMSSKVHWASDYPFAILIGYIVGKTAANRRIIKKEKQLGMEIDTKPSYKTDFSFNNVMGYSMIGVTLTF